jgi:hypothetical protein
MTTFVRPIHVLLTVNSQTDQKTQLRRLFMGPGSFAGCKARIGLFTKPRRLFNRSMHPSVIRFPLQRDNKTVRSNDLMGCSSATTITISAFLLRKTQFTDNQGTLTV